MRKFFGVFFWMFTKHKKEDLSVFNYFDGRKDRVVDFHDLAVKLSSRKDWHELMPQLFSCDTLRRKVDDSIARSSPMPLSDLVYEKYNSVVAAITKMVREELGISDNLEDGGLTSVEVMKLYFRIINQMKDAMETHCFLSLWLAKPESIPQSSQAKND